MKTAIVTGCNGFIGSAVVRELLENGYSVWAVGHNNHFSNLSEDSRIQRVSCDLNNIASLPTMIPAGEYSVFYHFAWEGSAGPRRGDMKLQLDNVQWTVNALRAAKELGCRRFFGAGSIVEQETIAAVYAQGNRPETGYIYGSAKLTAHAMCMCVAAEIGIELVWGKITNAYGAGEYSPRLVNSVVRKCMRGETPQFTSGSQNYDFVYIDDVARAIRLIGENGRAFHEYLIGSSNARPLKSFLMEMREAIAPDMEFQYGSVPFTGVDLPMSAFDCEQTQNDTGFRAEISFAEGCRKTLAWWREIEGRV